MLKRLKTDLEKHGLRQDKKKKRNKDGVKAQKDHDRRVLSSIRDAFSPFDVKATRHKSPAINVDSQIGRPDRSKLSAEQERKRTYQAEKRLKGRVGGVLDRRFGERDGSMSAEDKMVARYAREKLLRTQKSARFNLEDDADDAEELTLTHGGQALSFEDDFQEDMKEDSDSLEEPSSERQRQSVGSEAVPEEPEEPERKKTKAEVMQEVISKSKMHKAARQQAKSEDQDRIDELNEDFDSLLNELREADQTGAPDNKIAQDEYDQHVREMAFDRRAQPGDRTKTEEELREEAEEKRKKLMQERQQRMENQDLSKGERDDAELFGLHDDPDEVLSGSESETSHSSSESKSEDEDEAEAESQADETPDQNFVAPQSYKELVAALGDVNQIENLKILLRALAPSKKAGNKEKLGTVVVLMAKYATKCSASQFPEVLTLVREYASDFEIELGRAFRRALIRMNQKPQLGKSDLVLLSLISALFSTSDQWHPVVNVAQILIAKRLSSSVSVEECGVCLALCDINLVYQRIAKRYVPEVAGYLLRVLSAASDIRVSARYVRPLEGSITVSKDFSALEIEPSEIGKSLDANQIVLRSAALVDKSSTLWRSLPAFIEVFEPLHASLAKLPRNEMIEGIMDRLRRILTIKRSELQPLRLQDMQPVALRMKLPLFEENFNPENKAHTKDPAQRELQKLRALHKKERKSTLREIRRDTEFEARERLSETRDEKAKYHEMLRKVTSQINSEEGAEKNAYEREKQKHR